MTRQRRTLVTISCVLYDHRCLCAGTFQFRLNKSSVIRLSARVLGANVVTVEYSQQHRANAKRLVAARVGWTCWEKGKQQRRLPSFLGIEMRVFMGQLARRACGHSPFRWAR